jgi:hypothetical protein
MLRVIVIFVVLLAAYSLSYILLLDPEEYYESHIGYTECRRYVSFRWFDESPNFLQVLYKPLIALDHKWRPDYWEWSYLGR